jgi:sugar lactone lactonase YvrE
LNKIVRKQRKSPGVDFRFFAHPGWRKAWFARLLKMLAYGGSFIVLLTLQVAAQTNPLVVSTVAGLANFGSTDGIGSAAKFLLPTSVAVDGAGNVYVADAENFTIREISTNGVVTTIAGQAGDWGSSNGPATNGAQFLYPYGVAVDGSNNIYVADTENHLIRKIANGYVTTLAGQAGIHGTSNGMGTNAQFYYPYGVATDSSGNVYVADSYNSLIRLITPEGAVTTIGSSATFSYPFAVATDSAGNVYVADTYNSLIRLITPGGTVTTIASTASPAFYNPRGIAVDSATNIYVAEYFDEIIRVIPPGGNVNDIYTLAGSAGYYGDGDGLYRSPDATFYNPWGVAVDSAGNVYVGDSGNGNVRKIARPSDALSTLAGPDESYGVNTDGPEGQPRFYQPNGVTVDGAGNLYVADSLNNCIRMVTSAGTVTTLAGSINGYSGSADGTNTSAEFNNPTGLCLDAATNIYVADYDNSTVRKITPDAMHSNWVTTTIAGLASLTGTSNGIGTNARFWGPFAVAVDSATNLYVTDVTNQVVRKLTLSGANWAVSAYAGGSFNNPRGIAVDSSTNVFVADRGNNRVYSITPGGAVTPFATSGDALYNSPEGVAVDGAGNVYVANTGANTILGIPRGGASVATIAGVAGFTGCADGLGSAAQFDAPTGLAVDASGNVYVADSLNNTIRKGVPAYTLTVSASPAGGGTVGGGGTFEAGSTNAVTATNNSGYVFTNWTQGAAVVSTSSNYTFTLSSDVALVANFLPLYTVTVSASPTSDGTVSPGGTNVTGSIITVTATNNTGYAFVNWTSNGITTVSTTNYTFTLAANVALAAHFLPLYSYTVSTLPANAGTVSPGGTNEAGSTIIVTATNSNGYAFTNWTSNGITTVSTTNYTFTLATNVTLAANFVPVYTLAVSALPAGGGMVSAGGTFAAGSTITVAATNNGGYAFTNWTSNGIAAVSTTNYTISLHTNVVLVANFVATSSQIQVFYDGTNVIANHQTNAVNFGSALQKQPGPVITFTVTNAGGRTLDLTNITVPPGYSLNTNYPTNIVAGSNGAFSVQLTTNAIGSYSGEINITNNTPNDNPFSFPITGQITASIISLGGNLVFGVVPVGSSAQRVLTINNGGNAPLTVGNISYPAGFTGAFSSAIGGGGSTNVTVTFSPVAPTNYSGVLTVNSDATGGTNATAISAFGANTNLLLTIITNGQGSVTPNDARFLKAGTKYTLKAVPGSADVFSDWTGSTNSTNNPLTFVMEKSTILEANFVPNPFLPFVGTYNGLFWATNGGVAEGNAGMLKGLTLTSKGSYSGSLMINGASKSISGSFSAARQAGKPVSFGSPEGDVELAMTLTSIGPAPQVTGTVSGTGWTATNLIADRATTTMSPAEYTMLILPDTNPSSPGGDGYALITNTPGNGRSVATAAAKISGALADGTAFSQSVPVSQDGYVPIYANLYGGKGLLLGWINLDPTNDSGGLFWVHPDRPGLFKGAFTARNQIELSPWTNLPASSALPTKLAVFEMSDGAVIGTNDFTITISNNYKLGMQSGPTNLSGSLNPKTGLLTVTIGSGASKSTGYGVLLPNGTNGGGFFLDKTNAGAIILQP